MFTINASFTDGETIESEEFEDDDVVLVAYGAALAMATENATRVEVLRDGEPFRLYTPNGDGGWDSTHGDGTPDGHLSSDGEITFDSPQEV